MIDYRPTDSEPHTISVLVDNEFGVLARVIGLFSGRGYNIDSLTVNEVDHKNNVSRITIVTTGSEKVIKQIMALLEKLVPVHKVADLTVESPHIERGVALLKVVCDGQERIEALQLADRFGAKVVDSTETSFIFELTDVPAKVEKFMAMMTPLGLVESARTGITAMARGLNVLSVDDDVETHILKFKDKSNHNKDAA